MRHFTYLVYIILFEGAVLGGAYHAVFNLNRSGWWFLLAVIISGAAYSPRKWAALNDREVQHEIHLEKMVKAHKDCDR